MWPQVPSPWRYTLAPFVLFCGRNGVIVPPWGTSTMCPVDRLGDGLGARHLSEECKNSNCLSTTTHSPTCTHTHTHRPQHHTHLNSTEGIYSLCHPQPNNPPTQKLATPIVETETIQQLGEKVKVRAERACASSTYIW
jgi:hypothetical protein